LVPAEERAVQACVVVPTQYGKGVNTEPVKLVSPKDTCYKLTMPTGAEPADVLTALATVLGSEEGGSASLAEVSAATDCIYPNFGATRFCSRLPRGQ
jgi:hypothetical protein